MDLLQPIWANTDASGNITNDPKPLAGSVPIVSATDPNNFLTNLLTNLPVVGPALNTAATNAGTVAGGGTVAGVNAPPDWLSKILSGAQNVAIEGVCIAIICLMLFALVNSMGDK